MNILIVEDDKKIANYSKEGFEEENYVVDIVFNGEDALSLVKNKKYDVIILDWMLPGIDGIEVCKKIREMDIFTPIILLTAKVDINDRVYGLNSGADDYLPKPFAFEELLARVNALSRRANYKNSDIIKIDNLSINLKSRDVCRGDKKIDLTSKEYDILELLVKNLGHVVKIKTIIDNVWQDDDIVNSNIINVYLHHLRRKIDDNHRKKLIKTVRRHGYKIEA